QIVEVESVLFHPRSASLDIGSTQIMSHINRNGEGHDLRKADSNPCLSNIIMPAICKGVKKKHMNGAMQILFASVLPLYIKNNQTGTHAREALHHYVQHYNLLHPSLYFQIVCVGNLQPSPKIASLLSK
ncbi:hypothetical protein XELAEV_18012210mg, partial [Xenopus laevis]